MQNLPSLIRESALPLDLQNLPPLIRESALLPYLPFGHACLWRNVKRGRFPAPVRPSPRVTAWRKQDVLTWFDNLAA